MSESVYNMVHAMDMYDFAYLLGYFVKHYPEQVTRAIGVMILDEKRPAKE